jgi:hypothetical protein
MTTTAPTYRLRYSDTSERTLYFRRVGRTAYGVVIWLLVDPDNGILPATTWRTRSGAQRVLAEVSSELHSFEVEEVSA